MERENEGNEREKDRGKKRKAHPRPEHSLTTTTIDFVYDHCGWNITTDIITIISIITDVSVETKSLHHNDIYINN